MESIVNWSIEEICREGTSGLALQTLWSRLHHSPSFSNLLSPPLQQSLWTALLSVPTLNFFTHTPTQNAVVSYTPTDPSIQSFQDSENLNLRLVADHRLQRNFLGLYDAAQSPTCPHQRKTLERVASAGTEGVTQSQISKELGIKGENFFYKLKKLECQGLIVKQPLSNVNGTNLVYLRRYAKHLALGSEPKIESKEEDTRIKTKNGSNLIVELPIENQIYEVVNGAGSMGVLLFEVAERLGIDQKENRKRVESLCSNFGMVMDKEKWKKTNVYRVWGPGKRGSESANAVGNESENVTENVLDTAAARSNNASSECALSQVGVSDSQPECSSPQIVRNMFNSPFPTDSGKRAAKFAHWLQKREKVLMAEGIDLPAHIQCGDIFHLFALVSSGELSISPCLADGAGEDETLRSSKRNIAEKEYLKAKRLKFLVAESETISHREKGFPGLLVSVCRSESPTVNCINLSTDYGTSSSEKHFGGSYQLVSTSGQNKKSETLNSGAAVLLADTCNESWRGGILHPENCNIAGAQSQGPKKIIECPSEKCSLGGKLISPEGDGVDESSKLSGKLHVPRLPWINEDKTINKIIYEELSRRAFGVVMQNPGILEAEIIRKMDVLNPETCRELLASLIKGKHLHVRTMRQSTSHGPPAYLGSPFQSSLTQPKVVFRKHYFANSMRAFLL